MMQLSQLAIYPIKSTAQILLDKARISPFGLEMDRRLMLIDENSIMLTQRKHASLCLVKTTLQNTCLNIFAPNMQPLSMALDALSQVANPGNKAKVWDDTCNCIDCGDKAASWFTQYLKIPSRLVYFPEKEIRQVDLNYAHEGDTTAFSDGFPYLLIGQASLDDLNSRLEKQVDMRRFRPNLVIEGSLPFAEDSWKKIRIGDINFDLVKPCSRCVIPSIDPDTAKKDAEVVRALASYRLKNNKIFFGQNLIARGSGELTVGMPIEVIE